MRSRLNESNRNFDGHGCVFPLVSSLCTSGMRGQKAGKLHKHYFEFSKKKNILELLCTFDNVELKSQVCNS